MAITFQNVELVNAKTMCDNDQKYFQIAYFTQPNVNGLIQMFPLEVLTFYYQSLKRF
jgi:hypothetical protein